MSREKIEEEISANLKEKTLLDSFIENTYNDYKALFLSVAKDNNSSYFYFGDMQKNVFYLSDNAREDFGFKSNIVEDLLFEWGKRIATEEFKKIYYKDMESMLKDKREIHDLRYQVKDAYGNSVWIRCYGILKWDEKKEKPLFFSGRISHQDPSFVVDTLSNFPQGHVGIAFLNDLVQNRKKAILIGFSMNNIFEINNTRDRNYADRLIREICNELNQKLSYKMHFYRLEGIRFMAIIDTSEVYEAKENLMHQIKDIIDQGYIKAGINTLRSCSFGIMEVPVENMNSIELIEALTALIREAKRRQEEFLTFSNENLQQARKNSNFALAINTDIVNEMRNFRVVVQPIVSTESEEIVGGEVLLRWRYEGQDISPGIFIPILEKNSMIQKAGRWVFEEAVKTCVLLRKEIPDFYLTFNVSLQQLADKEFLPLMKKTLEKYDLDGKYLVAELTESSIDEQPRALQEFIEGCEALGMRIALDDFGSGYSSLRMLLQYPTSIIKIDRSLLSEMSKSQNKNNFITSIVYSCHQFGKTVCMEGVESDEQRKMIAEAKCDTIQGFYYYRPQELMEMSKLLQKKDL